ncbi:MAG TPA: DinB family protein [Candidatus Acidoferrales bacterium]|nr:DinB family protein [Candidatus Acidoferrales bacterium]
MPEGIHVETAEQYQARLNSYVVDKDPIEMLRAAPDVLAGLIEGAPDALLSRRPAEGKWSVRAILAHLAEDELASSWRYRQMIEHSGVALPGFDQDEWARLGSYESWPAAEGLSMFRSLREANLRMFGTLTPEEWQRHGFHAERGRITVEDLARHMAAHDVNHIMQVKRCLEKIQAQSRLPGGQKA